jgi:hypothetical protein
MYYVIFVIILACACREIICWYKNRTPDIDYLMTWNNIEYATEHPEIFSRARAEIAVQDMNTYARCNWKREGF